MNTQRVAPQGIWGRAGQAGLLALALMMGTSGLVGCERYKGAGFPTWNQSMGGMRGSSSDAKSSGFFTDRRSEQIEKNLGGF
ncbi:MAG: hypothetical protein ACO1RA_03850 [Planctomycetaceae bacterium]